MSLLIAGSIATDHLMTFQGKFEDSLVVEQLDKLSVSFLVEDLEIRRGGVAPNICFGLGQLGLNGQLLTPFVGSRCRLLLITTDAPLDFDAPVDFGIPAICDSCRVCVVRCPAGAIPARRETGAGASFALPHGAHAGSP